MKTIRLLSFGLWAAASVALVGCASSHADSMAAPQTESKEKAMVFDPTGSERFVQDRFAIGFWVDPPMDDQADRWYREIKEANFTLVLGGFGAKKPEEIERQLELCRQNGLVALVGNAHKTPKELPEHPDCWGYMLQDEPSTAAFPALADLTKKVREARPGRLAYIDLFPDYASPAQLGAESYDAYVSRFVKEIDPDVLCMNHYPFMTPENDTRNGYLRNLDVMRKYALERNIPHWNFFNVMPFGPHTDPTEAQLRWQIFTSLAYGSKGVLYFCYWTPRGGEFPKGGAIITAEGRKTRHYEQAKRINARLVKLGPTLMQLTSTEVTRLRPKKEPAEQLPKGSAVRSISQGDFMIGEFRHADGRRAVLLNNYSLTFCEWPTVEFDIDPARVREVDQETGLEVEWLDDSPDTPGMQVSLDSGEGRLFLLPAESAPSAAGSTQ